MREKLAKAFRTFAPDILSVLVFLAVVGGIIFGVYFNFMWFINTVAGFVTHIQERPVDGYLVAVDIGKFCIRGIVFLVSMLLFQIPAVLLYTLKESIKSKLR